MNNVFFLITSIFYNLYQNIKFTINKYKIISFSMFSIVFLSIFIYYLFETNPYNIMSYLKSTSIILYLFIIISLIITITINNINTFSNLLNYFKFIGYVFLIFLSFSFLYYISKNILYYGSNESSILTVFIIMSIMAIFYRNVLNKNNTSSSSNSNQSYNIIMEIIFYIPCLLLELIDYTKKDFSNTPSSTFILALITTLIVILYYIFPYIYSLFKDQNGIKLLNKKKEINTELIFVSQDELKKKIINSRPLLKRQILKFSNKVENNIKIHGNYFDETNSLFDVSKVYGYRKYINDYGKFDILKNHPDCKEEDLIIYDVLCDNSDNILKCNDKNIQNVYNINQTCNMNQSAFDYLFTAPKDVIKLYKNENDKVSDIDKKTLKEICESNLPDTQVSVNCVNYNDVSNVVSNQNNEYVDNSYYACNDLKLNHDDSNKYTILNAYNDNDEQIAVKCNSNIEQFSNMKEKFDNKQNKNFIFNGDYQKFININHSSPKTEENNEETNEDEIDMDLINKTRLNHKIDILLNKQELLNDYSKEEQEIIESYIKDDNGNLKSALSQFSDDPEKSKQFITSYFTSNENYMTLVRYINKYNGETNRFLNQELSNLVRTINMNNNIHTYNYHYGLSFWIYFDTTVLNNSQSYKKGLIMNYANQPKIYFDYLSNELVIEMYKIDKLEQIYKSKDILYQRWNHFVINFNYGVLDVFINNNLVFTTSDVTPYIDDKNNNIIFGSGDEPLHNCGLCNVVFFNKPLTLPKIKDIYKNNNNPCQ